MNENKQAEPVAYLHVKHKDGDQVHRRLSWYLENPFGEPGTDYSATYRVTSEPLYTHPPAEVVRGLVQALKDIGATGYSNVDRDKARAALAAAKEAGL